MRFRKPRKPWNWKFPEYCEGNKDAWKDLSEQCKLRDGYRCQRCGALGKKVGGTATLHAAHIVSKSHNGPDLLENLTTLCETCHKNDHPWLKRS